MAPDRPPHHHPHRHPADRGRCTSATTSARSSRSSDLAADPRREVYVFLADLHALNGHPGPADLAERSTRIWPPSCWPAASTARTSTSTARATSRRSPAGHPADPGDAKGLLNRAHAYKAAVAANGAAGRDPDHGVNMGLFSLPGADGRRHPGPRRRRGPGRRRPGPAPGDRRRPRPAVRAQYRPGVLREPRALIDPAVATSRASTAAR